MHLDPGQRRRALASIAALVNPGGLLTLSLRHGPVPAGRRMFEVSAEETSALAAAHGFTTLHHGERPSTRAPGVDWSILALRKAG
jgi:hypothetical protein